MPPIGVEFTRVLVATAEAGPYTTILLMRSASGSKSREGGARVHVMDSPDPKQTAGRRVNSYELEGLLDMADTTGQTVLRNAYDSGNDVFVQVIHNNAAATSQPRGEQARAKVTAFSVSGEREGDFVTVSFTLEGTGLTTALVAA